MGLKDDLLSIMDQINKIGELSNESFEDVLSVLLKLSESARESNDQFIVEQLKTNLKKLKQL